MQSAAQARMVVDYGAACVSAVLVGPDGRWQPILIDASPVLSSAVAVTADGTHLTGAQAWQAGIADPGRFIPAPLRLPGEQVEVGDTTVEISSLVAATLRRIADEAARSAGEPVAHVWMVVPASWGPRRRTWLRQAAAKAGLGQPTLVEVPVAVVQHLITGGRQVPVGAYVVVCDVGAGGEASVLRRNPSGLEVLSTLHDPAAGGTTVDDAVVAVLGAMTAGGPVGNQVAVLAAARAAKEAAARQPMMTVAVAAGGPALVVGADVIAQAAWPVLQRAADLTAEAIKAAELDTAQISAVLCVGGTAEMPLLGQAMRERLGVEPEKVLPPQTVALLGAAGIGGRPASAAPPVPPTPTVRSVWRMAVPGIAAFALFAHALHRVRVQNYHPVSGSRWHHTLLVGWGELATSSVLTMIFTLGAAVVIAGVFAHEHARGGFTSMPQGGFGAAIMAAVAIGVGLPVLGAIFAAAMFEEPTGAWLRWSVWPVIPIAAVAVGTAVLAARWRRVPAQGWQQWLNFPIDAVACVAAGTIMIEQAITSRWPVGDVWEPVVLRGGGFLLGIGIILAFVPFRRYRWMLAVPMGLFIAVVVSFRTTEILAGMFAVAVTLWWVQRFWQLASSPLRDVRL